MSKKKRERARKARPTPRLRKKAAPARLRHLDASRGGRPTKYKPEFCRVAAVMVRGGATDFELATAFGINPDTLYRWKATIPEFSESIAGARAIPIERVERSLYHRAVGYSFKATKIINVDGVVHAIDYVEHEPPDTQAASLWLRNVDPMRWRDRREVDPGKPQDTRTERELTDEELMQRLEAVEQRRRDAKAIPAEAVEISPSKELVPK